MCSLLAARLLQCRVALYGIHESRDKDSSLESTNPGFRDSGLTSPMTSLLGGVPGSLGGVLGSFGGAPGSLGGTPGSLGGAPGSVGGVPESPS